MPRKSARVGRRLRLACLLAAILAEGCGDGETVSVAPSRTPVERRINTSPAPAKPAPSRGPSR